MENDERLNALWGEISFLRKVVFYQKAEIAALRVFMTALLSATMNKTGPEAHEVLKGQIQKEYDKLILKWGDTNPEVAADIDIRQHAPESERDKWLFPE